MIYNISAMVVYSDQIEAENEEEAIDKFCADCPYDIDGSTIECEESEEQKMTREEALNKAINIVRYFEAHFAKSKEAREDAVNIIEVLEQELCEDAKAHSKKEEGRPVVLPYRERKCRRCKYGDAYELQKPCIVYSESCELFAEKE